jgi:hypothetical protein
MAVVFIQVKQLHASSTMRLIITLVSSTRRAVSRKGTKDRVSINCVQDVELKAAKWLDFRR